VDDSNWEPDGVTLQVRFCEGGKLYRVTGRLAATLQYENLTFQDLPRAFLIRVIRVHSGFGVGMIAELARNFR